jgi:hypothetical protein
VYLFLLKELQHVTLELRGFITLKALRKPLIAQKEETKQEYLK